MLREARSLLRTRLDAQDITVKVPDGDESPVVEADRTSLLRVVSNLLDNAIKYSPKGSTIHAGTGGRGRPRRDLGDGRGPGIPEHDLPRVFERFYKGEASRSARASGSDWRS